MLPLKKVLLLVFLGWLTACGQPPLMELQGSTMGTTYSIRMPEPPNTLERRALKHEVDKLLEEINAEMSTYDAQSSLSLLNRAPQGQWVDVPARLMQVLEAAADIHVLSGGVFDPTVGPLVNLWGFGPETEFVFPQDTQVEAALERVGYKRLLELNPAATRVRKQHADMYIDLSAIAKGFAVDEVAQLLETRGASRYLVEIGGEIRVAGVNPKAKLWRVAVENPAVAGRSVHGVLAVTDLAVATSGDYRNFFEHGGKRYSHSIDPRSGYPVDHNLVSVTVLHKSAMTADAMATALTVLGPEAGMQLAKALDLPVWFIVREGNKWIDSYSPAIESYRVN